MCKSLLRLKKSFVFAFALMVSLGASAQTQITNEAGLRAMASNLAGNYVLANDITLTSEWAPVGNSGAPFTGTLNGNGHVIKGLSFNNAEADFVGLFGVASGATIQNLRVSGADVIGRNHVGIVAGRATAGTTITGTFTSGYVNGGDHVGGIAGDAGEDNSSSTIANCMSTVYVYSRYYQGGGIVGWARGTNLLENNIFLGTAYVGAWGGCGGIVGFYENGTTTLNGNICAAISLTGNIGEAPVNGGNRYTLGIAGGPLNDQSILIATDNYTSENTVVYNREGAEIDMSVYDEDHHGVIVTDAELKTPATYTTIGFGSAWSLASGRYPVLAGMAVPFDGDYIHTDVFPDFFLGTKFDTKAVSPLGRTVTITSSNQNVVKVDGTTLEGLAAGTATITLSTTGDAYIAGYTITKQITVTNMDTNIASAADLVKMSQNPSGEFNITADIDLAGVEFTPLPEFSGILHGNGHVIRNMRYENTNQNNVGLFSSTRSAVIEDLGFEDAYLVGRQNVGAVAGHVYGGIVQRVYVSNSYIRGYDHIGSIAGDMSNDFGEPSLISNCISDSRISTWQYQTGGLVGVANGGTLENSLFSGTLENAGNTCNCGLISLLDSDGVATTIQNCISAAAHINGGTNPRLINLAGRSITLLNNYVIASTLYGGATKPDTGDADSADGLLIDDSEAKTRDFYENTLGWDFDNTWKFFDGAEGQMYPVLKWMKAPLKVRFFDFNTDPLVYTTGEADYKDVSTIHGSWGQDFSLNITEGANLVDYDESSQLIWCSDPETFAYLGSGTVTISVGIAPSLANYFSVVGDNSFSFITTSQDELTEIRTAQDFINIGKNPVGNYILMNDIDMQGVAFDGLFNSEGSFSGVLDGQGHRVKNAKVEISSGNDKGIFGKTSGATFRNIAFENFQVLSTTSGANHVGLVGSANSTTFEKVAVTGQVIARDHVALLAGDASGVTVKDCYVWGEVTAYSQVGGFFGCTLEGACSVENSYFNGDLQAQTRGWVGGFVGLIDKAESQVTIANCVSIGNCSSTGDGSPHYVGPFICGNGAGNNPNATVFFSGNISNIDAVMEGSFDWPDRNETVDGGDVQYATS